MTKQSGIPETTSATFLYLDIKERQQIIGMLPDKDSMTNLAIFQDISDKIKIEDLDKARVNWRPLMRPTGKEGIISGQPEMKLVGWEWDKDKDQELEFKFTVAETRLLKEIVTKLDDHRAITRESLPACRKIIESRPGIRRPEEVVDAIVEEPEEKTE